MGLEPEEYVPGENCPHCWGPGTIFGDYPPPLRVHLTGEGFEGVCEVFNSTFTLKQEEGAPCVWHYTDDVVDMVWHVMAGSTEFILNRIGGPNCYGKLEGPCAKHSADNEKSVWIS